MIKTNIKSLRDPFVVVENGEYYLYGTDAPEGWDKTVWACYKSIKGLNGPWIKTAKSVYVTPSEAEKNLWSPEVHKYKDSYYMFATYYSSKTKHRGCSILKSSSPEGQFVEITNGHITPADWDAIDGTFYVDDEGQPWMIFVHEWTCTDDGIGRMVAARLSDDLSHFVSEPVELFRADSPKWTSKRVTDGPFMYKTKGGELLMIWSNFREDDYCVAIARSKNGRVDGEWTHDDALLFSKEMNGGLDGGHGMIFKDRDGEMYLAIHSPNMPTAETSEQTVFIPLREENGTLICNI